jgi:hypothetical protein
MRRTLLAIAICWILCAAPVCGQNAAPYSRPLASRLAHSFRLLSPAHRVLLVLPVALFALLAVLGVANGLAQARSLRRRYCPACLTEMEPLDSAGGDALYVDSGQDLWELLGSMGWTVCRCPRCRMHSVEPRRAWPLRRSACPSCGQRTLEPTRETVERPTSFAMGSQRLTRVCHSCGHHDEFLIELPRLAGGGVPGRLGGAEVPNADSDICGNDQSSARSSVSGSRAG